MVVVAAARVGGIHANSTYPAEFLYDNMIAAMGWAPRIGLRACIADAYRAFLAEDIRC